MSARGDWREGLPEEARLAVADLGPVAAVRFDSREVQPGDVFVCIRGERSDGHAFASA
ncbi:MAG TPA: Mur ligase domain-containing protein, partial [Dehalococcoidia bacterium]|nr:Mur ligase domain-containing protein [Dehalococcoidia bacterium]